MEGNKNIQPVFLRDLLIGSIFAYRTFLKKGYRSVQRFVVDMNKSALRLSLHEKRLKNARLVKLFKRIKFVKKLDLSQLLSKNRDINFSTLLYIAKKMSSVPSLSVFDFPELQQSEYRGLFTTWPKYTKRLKSLFYHVSMDSPDFYGIIANRIPKEPKESKLLTDYIKYLQKLEVVKITFPNGGGHYEFLNKIWRFKKYPTAMKRLSLHHVNYEAGGELETEVASLAASALKNLKALEIKQIHKNLDGLTKFVMNLLPQLTQLQYLNIVFPEDFEIDGMICESMKRLAGLEKVKFEISSKEYCNNLQVLKSLEGCNLKSLNLRVTAKDGEDVGILIELLRKNKDNLETLKIHLIKLERFGGVERSEEFKHFFESVDDLPELMNFAFSIDNHKMLLGCTCELTETKIALKKIFSKSIPLKKFRLSFNTSTISEESFWILFESLKGIASNLEKIEIDFWDCYLENHPKADDGLDFIRSLENVRSVKLYGLFGTSDEAFFLRLMEAISGLRYLRTFWIGRISEKIDRSSLDEGLQRILSKPGLETFVCLSSADFEVTKREAGINVKEIKKKNPYFKKAQVAKITVHDDANSWKDDVGFV